MFKRSCPTDTNWLLPKRRSLPGRYPFHRACQHWSQSGQGGSRFLPQLSTRQALVFSVRGLPMFATRWSQKGHQENNKELQSIQSTHGTTYQWRLGAAQGLYQPVAQATDSWTGQVFCQGAAASKLVPWKSQHLDWGSKQWPMRHKHASACLLGYLKLTYQYIHHRSY